MRRVALTGQYFVDGEARQVSLLEIYQFVGEAEYAQAAFRAVVEQEIAQANTGEIGIVLLIGGRAKSQGELVAGDRAGGRAVKRA